MKIGKLSDEISKERLEGIVITVIESSVPTTMGLVRTVFLLVKN